MPGYKLLTLPPARGGRAAVLIDGLAYDLAEASGNPRYADLLGVLADWAQARPVLEELAAKPPAAGGFARADDGAQPPPLVYPPAVYCAGANYSQHVANMEKRLGMAPSPDPRENGGKPFHFLKASRCCVGDGAMVRTPSKFLDWEGELVAVVGAEARNVSAKDALGIIAGYTVGNDLSARDVAFRAGLPTDSVFRHSWLDHKSFEGAAPLGPWIVPASEVGDPQDLRLRTWVNGVVKQDSNTADMIFSLAEQIAYLTSVITLVPGDVIFTGTPAGVGAETGECLSPGDSVAVEIEKVGRLTTVIA